MFFDKYDGDLCKPCDFGTYQPDEGKFKCLSCGVGLTTRTKVNDLNFMRKELLLTQFHSQQCCQFEQELSLPPFKTFSAFLTKKFEV